MKDYRKYRLDNGINLHCIRTDKFKTSTVSIAVHRSLNKLEATKNALLPRVLRCGCKEIQDSQKIARYLEELYAASFDFGVTKKGENQIIYFNFEIVNDKYIPDGKNLLEEILNFAKCIIFNPKLEEGIFKEEYVEQEKIKLKDSINSLIDNKVLYAVERCLQEMCKEEAYSIYELGRVEDIDSINANNLYEHYIETITNSPIDIFIIGSIIEDDTYLLANNLFDNKLNNKDTYPITNMNYKINEVKKIKEKMSVTQAKLSLGFRTNVNPIHADYYKLMVYNSILGGGPHSKLFNNVREEMSLAYYVFSRLEKYKGLMVISSGIETQNYDKALDAIFKQMEEIKKGKISEYEYTSTINSIVNSINSIQDSPLQVSDYYLGQMILNKENSLEELISQIKRVTKEDVVSMSNNIELDTIYFLASNDKEEE